MYVITGASGNTGRLVAATLLAAGQKVRVLGRNTDRLQRLADRGAERFVCDLTDQRALIRAFADAQAAYVMIPPHIASDDYRLQQDRISETIATALEKTRVPHAVSLSSVGADKAQNTGPVVGLHRLEQRLNQIPGLNVLHLRAGYFMENTLAQIGGIKTMGATAGPLHPDLRLPMIATRDIAVAAADALLKLDFRRSQTRELLGQRDLSMAEVTAIIGKAIHKPELTYVEVSDDKFLTALTSMGMSLNVARLLVEMAAALNSGHMIALERRSTTNTTPTAYETFVADEFAPRYQGTRK